MSPAQISPGPKPRLSLLPRIAIVTGLILASTSIGASTIFLQKAVAQQPPGLAGQPYVLRCWQDSVQILNIREPQALQSFADLNGRGLTLENADGSRRLLAPMGDSLCVLEFTAAKS